MEIALTVFWMRWDSREAYVCRRILTRPHTGSRFQGKQVVRLKGGCPAVFSRVASEVHKGRSPAGAASRARPLTISTPHSPYGQRTCSPQLNFQIPFRHAPCALPK